MSTQESLVTEKPKALSISFRAMAKLVAKRVCFIIAVAVDIPFILLTHMETWLRGKPDGSVFNNVREILALCPTRFGDYLRRAYYWGVCDNCSPDVCYMFGSMLAHQGITIRKGVVIGAYSLIGYADIGTNVLFAANVSILSGKYQHGRPIERASEISRQHPQYEVVHIGANSWVGQGAIILANIGCNCTVGAGSVVFRSFPDNCTILGNPARKVNLENPPSSDNCTHEEK